MINDLEQCGAHITKTSLIPFSFFFFCNSRNPKCSKSVLCGSDGTQGFVSLHQLSEVGGGVSSPGSPHVSSQIQVSLRFDHMSWRNVSCDC